MWRLIRVDQNTSLPSATNQGARKRSETNEREPRVPMISLRPRAGKISLSLLRPSDYTFLPSEFFAKNSFFDLFKAFYRLFRYAFASQKGEPLALALTVAFSLPFSFSLYCVSRWATLDVFTSPAVSY